MTNHKMKKLFYQKGVAKVCFKEERLFQFVVNIKFYKINLIALLSVKVSMGTQRFITYNPTADIQFRVGI